jgi:superfamily II DNA helicase RecQ
MTATCPVNLEREILGTLGLTQCRVIRAMTPRPEISYKVTVCGSQPKALAALEREVKSTLPTYREGEKAFIYCRSVSTVKTVARLVGCEPFHAQVDNEERDEIWAQFLANPAKKLLVSTCVLGAGVDVPHVRNVWHFGLPWSMIEYAQETGRAGRDGLNSRSTC